MRILKLCLVVGLIGAAAMPAAALTFNVPYNGPIKFKFSDWEVGTIYLPSNNNNAFTTVGQTVTLTTAEMNAAQANQNPAVGNWFSVAPPKAQTGEEGWGIWRLDGIYGDPANDQSYSLELYTRGQPSKDVWGMFYGINDMQVSVTLKNAGANPGLNTGDEIYTLSVWSEGMAGGGGNELKFDLYETTSGVDLFGPASSRSGMASFPGVTGGTPFLSGTAIVDVLSGAPVGGMFTSTSDIDRASNSLVKSITPIGSARVIFDVDPTVGDGAFYQSVDGLDIIFTTNVYGYTGPLENGWMARTDDPAFANFVPEPLTVMGLGMGIGGLFGYIRKRRIA